MLRKLIKAGRIRTNVVSTHVNRKQKSIVLSSCILLATELIIDIFFFCRLINFIKGLDPKNPAQPETERPNRPRTNMKGKRNQAQGPNPRPRVFTKATRPVFFSRPPRAKTTARTCHASAINLVVIHRPGFSLEKTK